MTTDPSCDDDLINDPTVKAEATRLAKHACQDVRAGLTLLRATALTIAQVSALNDDPEAGLEAAVAELADNARQLLGALLAVDEPVQSEGAIQ